MLALSATVCVQCYKAVPALALHLMKKASNEGSARLNVIRIVDAVISKSRVKHKQTDKFGAFPLILLACVRRPVQWTSSAVFSEVQLSKLTHSLALYFSTPC